jgi:hypothetical protein
MKIAFYKATRPGLMGIYNLLVCWWTRSPYSHAEIVFKDGLAASSSLMDGGVRFKRIDFNPAHWDFLEITGDEFAIREWFIDHEGDDYDLMGNVGFVIGFIRDSEGKFSCAESIAAALGYTAPWRYSPAILHSLTIGTRR